MNGTGAMSWRRALLLLLVAVALAVVPLALRRGVAWQGADQRSVEAIRELWQDYEPWFSPIVAPQQWERYLFGLQAFAGTSAIAGALGWLLGRRSRERGLDQVQSAKCKVQSEAAHGFRLGFGLDGAGGRPQRELNVAAGITAAAMALAAGLAFVRTPFGELQAFISAVQGICLGFLGFFVGYPLGRRLGARRSTPDLERHSDGDDGE